MIVNEQNLIPFTDRSESEVREMNKKGGVKSGETRRRKRDLSKIARQFMEADTGREDLRAALQASGFDDDQSNAAALVMQIAAEAFSGNIRAAELLLKLAGNDPDQKRKDAELKIKQEELKLKRALINQQTIKLKNFNFGDTDDLNWLIQYEPNNPQDQIWLQVAAMEIDEYVKNGGNIDEITEKYRAWIEDYASRKYAEELILMKQKLLRRYAE